MAVSLRELARLVNAEVQGNPDLEITGARVLRNAGPQDITLLDSTSHLKYLDERQPAAMIAPRGILPAHYNVLICSDAHGAFARIVNYFRPLPQSTYCGVSPAAHVHPTAQLGANVTIYPHAFVGENVVIGEETVIHSGCSIMAGCTIGGHCMFFPNVVLYEGTRVGKRVLIHANATLGAYGFGYRTEGGRHMMTSQLGYVEVGDDVEIGAGTTIDRGTYDHTRIGDGTKIDNQVMIGHNCQIGRHNMLCAQVGIAGSCHTGDYVVMGGQVGIRDHVNIGSGALLGAQSGIHDNVPAGVKYLGTPAGPEKEQRHTYIATMRLPAMRKQLKELARRMEKLTGQSLSDPDREAA